MPGAPPELPRLPYAGTLRVLFQNTIGNARWDTALAAAILLFYRRTMDRIWKATLALGVLLIAVSFFSLLRPTQMLGMASDAWLFVTAAVALALSIFAFFARFIAYVQAQPDSLKIVTPFLRFHVSYKRMRSVRPTLTQQVFPPENRAGRCGFLEPFYGKTVLVVELKGFPISPGLLKLFLPDSMFARTTTGLVLLVPDWMQLSTDIDSFRGTWLQKESVARIERRH
jgi:hypothetical protein